MMDGILEFLVERGCVISATEKGFVILRFADREIHVNDMRITFFIVENETLHLNMEKSFQIISVNRDTLYKNLNDHFEKIAMECL